MKRNIKNSLWLLLGLLSFLVAFVFLTAIDEDNYQTIIRFVMVFVGLGTLGFFAWIYTVAKHFYNEIEELRKLIK